MTARRQWSTTGLRAEVYVVLLTAVTSTTLAAAARFHGHLGPWLVLGLRAGIRARQLGGSPFNRRAVVWCPGKTPYSCFIDGIQFTSGCTLGKVNIRHIPSHRCRVRFNSGRRALTLTVRPELFNWLDSWQGISEAEVERLARRILRSPFPLLFAVKHG